MFSEERRVAVEAARAAGRLLLDGVAGRRRIRYKGSPTNLVTEMDARAERLILERLGAAFPDDGVLAEEAGARGGRSGRRWIVDPLDGTTNYAHGLPIYAVSIALEAEGRVALGGERGGGARLNDAPIAVSTARTLNASLLATGFPYDVRRTRANLAEFEAFTLRARAVRRLGSAVLYLAWVAAGRLDGYWELSVGPWDVAAGMLLVEEAGGRVSDPAGGRLDLAAPAIVASNGRIHRAMLDVLAATRRAGGAATGRGRRSGRAGSRPSTPRSTRGRAAGPRRTK
jgi:myo-inositol-1(or 4)-monophosphatase